MKNTFAGYYRPTDAEFDELWKKCIFVFDASVLLDLYRSTAQTRSVLISILEKISDRIWLSYQAGWEYQENRLDVIAKERELYTELRDTLNGLVKSIQQKMHNHAVESAEKIRVELESSIKRTIEIIDQGATEHPDLIAKDYIQEKISQLFDGKVGKKMDEKRLATIYQEGPKRYEQKIPPGYKDTEKGGTRQFGDLVIWNEMLSHALAEKLPVVFITSDTKEDWWWKQGQFTVGPRPELVQEMAAFASARFYMYNVERFVNEAQKRFDTEVGTTAAQKAAEEFKEIETKREGDSTTGFVEYWTNIIKNPGPGFAGISKALSNEVSDYRTLREILETLPSGMEHIYNVQEWIFILEKIFDRPLTPVERTVTERVVERKDLGKIARGAKSCWDVAGAFAVYLKTMAIRNQ